MPLWAAMGREGCLPGGKGLGDSLDTRDVESGRDGDGPGGSQGEDSGGGERVMELERRQWMWGEGREDRETELDE